MIFLLLFFNWTEKPRKLIYIQSCLPEACQTLESDGHDGCHLASELGELLHSHHLLLVPEEAKLLLQLVFSAISVINEREGEE
jgi:hypothetical protein